MNLRDRILIGASDMIYEALEKCAVHRKLIYTDSLLRGVGKTTALVKLAKKYDLTIVTPRVEQRQYLKSVFNFDNSISQSELKRSKGKVDYPLVFDEGVDPSNLVGYEVVTGFVQRF